MSAINQSPSPFPFLRLPPELRNKVYEYATEAVRSRRGYGWMHHNRDPIPYISLIWVCRQIREEYYPLLSSIWYATINLSSLRKFLRDFVPNNMPFWPLASITVHLDLYFREAHMYEWNLLPFLQSLNRLSTTTWSLNHPGRSDHAYCKHYTCRFLWGLIALARKHTFDRLSMLPISSIEFHRFEMLSSGGICGDLYPAHYGEWRLLLQKDEGQLTLGEESKLEDLCRTLSGLLPQHTNISTPNPLIGGSRRSYYRPKQWVTSVPLSANSIESSELENIAVEYLADVHVRLSDSKGHFMVKYTWHAAEGAMMKRVVDRKLRLQLQVGSQGGRAGRMRW